MKSGWKMGASWKKWSNFVANSKLSYLHKDLKWKQGQSQIAPKKSPSLQNLQ